MLGLAIAAVLIDLAILVWLVFTWFYEGNHRKCTVIARCDSCDKQIDVPCASADCEYHGIQD